MAGIESERGQDEENLRLEILVQAGVLFGIQFIDAVDKNAFLSEFRQYLPHDAPVLVGNQSPTFSAISSSCCRIVLPLESLSLTFASKARQRLPDADHKKLVQI